jgi:glycerol-1-phosphate dehydrogenase [NAD(P)+]
MSNERIQAALREATDTKCVVIGAGAVQSIDAVFSASFHDQPAMVIADDNTYEVAGKQVQQRLEAAGRTLAEHYVFPGRPTLHVRKIDQTGATGTTVTPTSDAELTTVSPQNGRRSQS